MATSKRAAVRAPRAASARSRDSAPRLIAERSATATGRALGRLEGVTPEGRLLVQLAERPPVECDFTLSERHAAIIEAVRARATVLVELGLGEHATPLVVGIVRQRLVLDETTASGVVEPRLELRATERLTLACGPAAIVLSPDGRVELRGTDVRAESAGAIRLRGGHVDIN